jgi:hypothetical protein
MTSVPETPGPRAEYERALRRTAERQQMRLVRSARRDPKARDYSTYMLISQFGEGPTVLKHASLQEVEAYLHMNPSKLARVPPGERTDVVDGAIVGVQPGVIIDSLENNKRFLVARDGDLVELPDEGWATIPDEDS